MSTMRIVVGYSLLVLIARHKGTRPLLPCPRHIQFSDTGKPLTYLASRIDIRIYVCY